MTGTRARAAALNLARRAHDEWRKAMNFPGIVWGETWPRPDHVAGWVEAYADLYGRIADAVEQAIRERDAEWMRADTCPQCGFYDEPGVKKCCEQQAKVITLLKQQAVESEESMVIVGRTVASMAEEIAFWKANDVARIEEIARLKAEIVKVHTSKLMKTLSAANEEIARMRAVVKRVHGNYQPACPLCQDHRHWTDEALRVPGRGTEYDTI